MRKPLEGSRNGSLYDFCNWLIQKKVPDLPELRGWAEEWVLRIAELYRINNERVKYPKGSELFLQYDTKLRKSLSEMKADSEKKYDDDAQAAAMNSMRERWSELVLFVKYPKLPMDKNLMENGMRPCALGKNKFLGNHSTMWRESCRMHVLYNPDMPSEQDKSQGLSPSLLQCLCKQQGNHVQRQGKSTSSI